MTAGPAFPPDWHLTDIKLLSDGIGGKVWSARDGPGRAARMATILSERLAIPGQRLLGFGAALACLSACWHLEDGNVTEADRSLDVAEAIMPLLAD